MAECPLGGGGGAFPSAFGLYWGLQDKTAVAGRRLSPRGEIIVVDQFTLQRLQPRLDIYGGIVLTGHFLGRPTIWRWPLKEITKNGKHHLVAIDQIFVRDQNTKGTAFGLIHGTVPQFSAIFYSFSPIQSTIIMVPL